jgi:hypothetical protein
MTKEAKMKTYGVAITAGGTKYHFHVDRIKDVRELFSGSRYVTDFQVTEESRTNDGCVAHREMPAEEVQDIIWGRAS